MTKEVRGMLFILLATVGSAFPFLLLLNWLGHPPRPSAPPTVVPNSARVDTTATYDPMAKKKQKDRQYPEPVPLNIKAAQQAQTYLLFTDGGYDPSYDIGAWAFRIYTPQGTVIEDSAAFTESSSNRAEMLAVIHALMTCEDSRYGLICFSDSQLLINTLNKGWKRRKNQDLWGLLDRQIRRFPRSHWEWVKGHAQEPDNIFCDAMAKDAMSSAKTREIRDGRGTSTPVVRELLNGNSRKAGT
ncbi:MAG: RNase H family protein [Halothece sp.]